MWASAGGFAGRDELLHQSDIGFVDDLGITVAVHGGKVDDGVAGGDKVLKLRYILEIVVFERDARESFRMQAEGVVQVRADEAGLASDAYSYA